jgi:uncharacterized repeat protein (TIGR01451 family)
MGRRKPINTMIKIKNKKKNIALIVGGIFATIMLAVLVVYSINKPATEQVAPSPVPTAQPIVVNEVTLPDVCSLSFSVSEMVPPVCNEACNDTTLICPTDQECIYADASDTTGLCRLPAYPDSATCTPPGESPTPSPSITPSPSPSDSPNALLDCVVKRVYEDDSQNAAGVYYLNREITDTNTLTNGQVIVYNIVVANTGDGEVSETTIEDVLSSNLTYMDASSGCTYDSTSRKVTCAVGTVPGNTETSKSIRVSVATSGTTSINNRADVFSTNGQRDVCEITVGTTGVIEQPPSPVPSSLPEAGVMEVTTATLSIGVLLLLVGGLGLLIL